jgi:hypothetical protein
MMARLLLRDKLIDGSGDIRERVVWSVKVSPRHPQGVRYRLAYIPQGEMYPTVLYDNHHPKGHHKHIEGREEPYIFTDVGQMQADFERDIALWKKARRSA